MKYKISPDIVIEILSEFQRGVSTSQRFPKLLTLFRPLIYSMAGSYSFSWKEDFAQEGTLGLYKAVESYSLNKVSPDKFISYAKIAIRRKMTDFYRRVIGKGIEKQIEYTIDGGEQKFLQPIFTNLNSVRFDDELEDPFNNIPSSCDSASATIQNIDFKYQLSTYGLTRNGFSEDEITAFNLHFIQGYGVSEVAKQIGVSVPQSSKIIAKTRKKLLQIFAIQ